MIYGFQLETFLWHGLMKRYKYDEFRNITKLNKLQQLVKPGDTVIMANYTEKATNTLMDMSKNRIRVFPRTDIRELVSNRKLMLQKLENVTQFNLLREYYDRGEVVVPKLGGYIVVGKIGNEHQGKDKELYQAGALIKAKEPIVFEEFISNAKSLRVIALDENKENWYIVEYLEPKYPCEEYLSNSWIKNIQCEFKTYNYKDRYETPFRDIDLIIKDVEQMQKVLNHGYLAFDYVQNENKTGFLEVNDIPGMPEDNKELLDKAVNYFINWIDK